MNIQEGIIKVDTKRIMTKIMGAIGYKHDPKMREELLAAFKEDLERIMAKHDYVVEAEDHEVGMAMGQLSSIHEAATDLEDKIGTEEKDLPAWIQAHITSAYEYLKQANDNFHELDEADFYNLTPNNIGGMGPISLPGVDSVGSGDVPAGQADDDEEEDEDNRNVLSFEAFVNEFHQIKAFEPERPGGEKLGEDDYEPGPANDPDAEMKERMKTLKKARGVISFKDFNPI